MAEGRAVGSAGASGGRFTSLDGLRGLASLMVVFTHVRLAADVPGPTPSRSELLESWLRGGFLGIVGDGATAVAIFFVLSGIVLVLPFLRRRTWKDWLSYYPRRLVRIYLPVWGSILLGLAWWFLVPRRREPGLPWWISDHATTLTAGGLARALALIQSTDLNTPLWSLHWEIQFSLLLPLFVLAVLPRWRWWGWAVVVGSLALVGLGAVTGSGALVFLPQFLIGAALATRIGDLRERLAGLSLAIKLGIAGLALAAIAVVGLIETLALPNLGAVAWILRMVGSTLVVLVFLAFGRARRLAETRVVQWLGRISFSLYLVHEPLVVSLRLLYPFTYWQLLAIALPASLVLAQVFYWVCERPAHLASRWVGRQSRVVLGGVQG